MCGDDGCERARRCLEKDDLCDYCEWKLDQEAVNDWLDGSEEIESFYYNTKEKGEIEYESDMPF